MDIVSRGLRSHRKGVLIKVNSEFPSIKEYFEAFGYSVELTQYNRRSELYIKRTYYVAYEITENCIKVYSTDYTEPELLYSFADLLSLL